MKYAKKFIADYNLKHFVSVVGYRCRKNVRPFPPILQIQTSNSCNSSCQMCPNTRNKNRPKELMEDEVFQRIILEVEREARKKTLILLYLQNEPLTDSRLWEKVRFVQDHNNGNLSVGILTNGSLLTKDTLEKVIQSRIDFISISLDAYSKQTYEKIRTGLDFNTVQKNLEELLQSKFDNTHVAVEYVLQKSNVSEFEAFKRYWSSRVGAVMVNHLSNRSGQLPDYEELSANRSRFGVWDRFQYGMVRHLVTICPKPYVAFHITSNGDVLLCTEDYARKMIVGNIKTASIKEIWNSEKYNKLRKQIGQKQYKNIDLCKDCSLWRQRVLHWF